MSRGILSRGGLRPFSAKAVDNEEGLKRWRVSDMWITLLRANDRSEWNTAPKNLRDL